MPKLSVVVPVAKAPPQFEGSCHRKCEACEEVWGGLTVVVVVMVAV